jgi:hypothetical protein
MSMTDDQLLRLQCLDMAIAAGTPWERLPEWADRFAAYVRGPGVTTPLTRAIDDLERQQPLASAQESAQRQTEAADKGVAVEHERDWPTFDEDMAADSGEAVEDDPILDSVTFNAGPNPPKALAIHHHSLTFDEAMADRGEPIEERDALMRNVDYGKTDTLAAALLATLPKDQRGEPVEEQPPGAVTDPRLPTVTM